MKVNSRHPVSRSTSVARIRWIFTGRRDRTVNYQHTNNFHGHHNPDDCMHRQPPPLRGSVSAVRRNERGELIAAKFGISKRKAGKVRFHLKAANGEIIAANQGVETREGPRSAVSSVKTSAPAAKVVELTEWEPAHN